MLDLRQYNCLGEALRAGIDRWADEVCLIEADRDREKQRFTYRQFKEAGLALARAMQDAGFGGGTRAAILMTNQSKWLISAYAIFFRGGVLVPVDYKLTPVEQIQLLAHSKAEFLVVEYHAWRALTQAPNFGLLHPRVVLVGEAPPNADLAGAKRWEEFHAAGEPDFVARAQGSGLHRLFVWNGGTAERLRADARELPGAVHGGDAGFPVFAGGPVSQHYPDEPCDRFHGRIRDAVYRRRDGGAFAHASAGVYTRCVCAVSDNVHGGGAADPDQSAEGAPGTVRRAAAV
jgi:hypothetical protein